MRSEGRQQRPPQSAYRTAFGANLKRLREATGISQESLAHHIGMSRRYLSGIERGEANPTLDQILRLAAGLDIEVRRLFPASK